MSVRGFRQACAALQAAEAACGYLAQSKTHEDTTECWINFIQNVERYTNKLFTIARLNNATRGWAKRIDLEIKSSPLLNYIRQARHADQHSTEEIAASEYTDIIYENSGGLFFEGRKLGLIVLPMTTYLRPVKNRGILYYPPSGNPTIELRRDKRTPKTAMKEALPVYRRWLEEAKRLHLDSWPL